LPPLEALDALEALEAAAAALLAATEDATLTAVCETSTL
jgi:hypothetical protein